MEVSTQTTRWFERTANPPRMVVTARDRRILEAARDHRLISTEHVSTLLSAESPCQVRKVRKRLRLLYDHRLLDLPPLQTLDHRRKGSAPKVYALSRQGAQELGESSGVRNSEIGRRFFEHTLMITSLMVSLEQRAAEVKDLRVVPFEEILAEAPKETQEDLYPNRWQIEVSKRESPLISWRETIGVTPDKIFAIEFTKAPRKRGRFLLFLEADRGTEPIMRTMSTRRGTPKPKQLSSIYRKLLAYKASFNEKLSRRETVRLILDRRCQQRNAKPPIPIQLPDNPKLKDLVVKPHSLHTYDDLDDLDDGDEDDEDDKDDEDKDER